MKMFCPVCYREISVTSSGRIRRHGFKKDRWSRLHKRTDSQECKGTGRTGLSTVDTELVIEDIDKRTK